MKKNKILKIFLLLGIVSLFFIVGIAYAFFSMNRQSNEFNMIASSCFHLELTNSNILSENNVPMTDEDAKNLVPYSFTIKNTCTTSAEVGINLEILRTTNATLSNYKVSLNNGMTMSPSLINDLESEDFTNSDVLLVKKLGSIYIGGNSEKNIELRLWMKDTIMVGEGENEIIESKIALTAVAVPVELGAASEKIIADNGGLFKIRGNKEVDLKKVSPELFLYKETQVEDDSYNEVLSNTKWKYANSYIFNPKNGEYSLQSSTEETLSNRSVGMFTCKNNEDTCKTMYKVKGVEINPISENYSKSDPVVTEMNASSSLTGNKSLGKGFHVNQETGKFVLDDKVSNAAFTEEYIGYYACSARADTISGRTTTCNYLHEILEVATDPGEGKYYNNEVLNNTVSFSSNEDKMVAQFYNFDSETGNYTLINPISSVSYANDYIDYYTCNTNTDICTTLYKIKEIEDGTITKADKLVKTTRYHHAKKTNVYHLDANYSNITLADKYGQVDYSYQKDNTGLYLGEDDFGDTYYFRGGNDANNIFFAGNYWNIIRINGDGSIRMIYRGENPNTSGEESLIGKSIFNNSSRYNGHVGYMIGGANSTTKEFEHTNNPTSSTIKTILEQWYENNILTYNSFVADSLFCNDRSIYSGLGYGTNETRYMPDYRTRNVEPTLKCNQKNDRFTVTNSYGNQNNKYPIGLITIDEVMFAGMTTYLPKYNYLNTQIDYWTMTPASFTPSWKCAQNFSLSFSSSVQGITGYPGYSSGVTYNLGVRPVINLKGNVILSGTGTLDDPYRVEGLQTE